MDMKNEWKPLTIIAITFLLFFYLPLNSQRLQNAVIEALYLTQWYAREHVLLCLIPAFFIAGAIAVFVSQASVMKYLGAKANKVLAYGVASVSGTILAVCSCTVLPLFAGIYRMGAGLGPATAFLYSGPAINVLAIILTARILGLELGIARAVGAIVFSVVIGLLMHFIFRREEYEKADSQMAMPEPEVSRPLWQNGLYFAVMVAILVFANWGRPDANSGFWFGIYSAKWVITGIASLLFAFVLVYWFKVDWWKTLIIGIITIIFVIVFPHEPMIPFAVAVIGLSIITATGKGETKDWFDQSWGFAKQIMPLLFFGVLVAGLLLGRPGEEGIIPSSWISQSVGGNSMQFDLGKPVCLDSRRFYVFCNLNRSSDTSGSNWQRHGQGSGAGASIGRPGIVIA